MSYHMFSQNGDEERYLAWIKNHGDEFVINVERSPRASYMVLHHAWCGSISRYRDSTAEGAFTQHQYIKVCGNIASLHDWVKRNGRHDGTFSSEHSCYK